MISTRKSQPRYCRSLEVESFIKKNTLFVVIIKMIKIDENSLLLVILGFNIVQRSSQGGVRGQRWSRGGVMSHDPP